MASYLPKATLSPLLVPLFRPVVAVVAWPCFFFSRRGWRHLAAGFYLLRSRAAPAGFSATFFLQVSTAMQSANGIASFSTMYVGSAFGSACGAAVAVFAGGGVGSGDMLALGAAIPASICGAAKLALEGLCLEAAGMAVYLLALPALVPSAG